MGCHSRQPFVLIDSPRPARFVEISGLKTFPYFGIVGEI